MRVGRDAEISRQKREQENGSTTMHGKAEGKRRLLGEMRGGAGGGGGETGDDMMERKRWADRVVASWVNVLRGVEEWWGIFFTGWWSCGGEMRGD
jgi:hypothetical protein